MGVRDIYTYIDKDEEKKGMEMEDRETEREIRKEEMGCGGRNPPTLSAHSQHSTPHSNTQQGRSAYPAASLAASGGGDGLRPLLLLFAAPADVEGTGSSVTARNIALMCSSRELEICTIYSGISLKPNSATLSAPTCPHSPPLGRWVTYKLTHLETKQKIFPNRKIVARPQFATIWYQML